MSRSIHETRRSCNAAKRLNFSDKAEHRRLVRSSLRRLWAKKCIKMWVAAERRGEVPPPLIDPVPAELVPVRIVDESPLIHHGASADDVSELLKAIPAGYTDGLSEIRLCLGKSYVENVRRESLGMDERDPHFQRRSMEMVPGLYAPHVCGTCFTEAGLIFLYDYVWDKSRLGPLPEFIPAIYLKVKMLSVLLHEVAHHFDRTNRIARGRWRMARRGIVEEYAETMEHRWQSEYLIPFITRKYAEEWQAFQDWAVEFGGLVPKWNQLLGDHRHSGRYAKRPRKFPTEDGIESLMKSVAEGESRSDSRYSYAYALCMADEFEDSLAVTTRLVQQEPDNVEFLKFHAYTLYHLKRWNEARSCLNQAMELSPTDLDIWKDLARLTEKQCDWPELLRISEQGLSLLGNEKSSGLLIYKATALYAFSRLDEMKATLQLAWSSLPEPKRSKKLLMTWRKNICKTVFGGRK